MKYLKLVADLPKCTDGNPSHITFAYFGKIETDPRVIGEQLKPLKPFVLRKLRADVFGTIPVVVYETDSINVQEIRRDVIGKAMHQNFAEWAPHISHVDFDAAPQTIEINAIVSNDDSIVFNLLKETHQ